MTVSWTAYLAPLYALDAETRHLCGEKAWNLAQALRRGHPVPPAVCVSSTLLPKLLQRANAEGALARYAEEGLNRTANATALILDTPWPPSLVQALMEALRPIGDVFAVRSSSRHEDRREQSRAGYYCSLLGVRLGARALRRAVATCWASAFSPLGPAWGRTIDPGAMAVLIQRQVEPAVSGVCFSREPERPESGLMVAELVAGTGARLVGGEPPAQKLAFRRADGRRVMGDDVVLSARAQAVLIDLALCLEQQAGGPVDLEWALDRDDVLWLLQVRPLAVWHVPPGADGARPLVVRLEDDIAALDAVSGPVRPVVEARMDKRRHVHRAAERIGIDYSREGFFIPNDARPGADDLRRALSWIRTAVVETATQPGKFERRHRADLDAWLLGRSAQSSRRADAIYVSEFHANEVTGFASRTTDHGTLVEYIPGGFGGFLSDDLAFSHVELDAQGRVVAERLERYDRAWYWNDVDMTMRPVARPPATVRLDPADIESIRRMTLSLSEAFGEVRLEWIKTRDRLLVWDLSLETAALVGGGSQVLCPGEARGPAFVIETFAETDRVAPDRSVIPGPEFYVAYESSAGQALRDRLRALAAPPIVVAPYPRTSLAVYLGAAAAFVFDAGATLCHLGIILRESRVPSVFWPNATRRIRTGEWIEIRNGRVLADGQPQEGEPDARKP